LDQPLKGSMKSETSDFNFLQNFAPVTEANLLFRFQRFNVYENVPLKVIDPSVYYLTLIPFQFDGVAETAILGIKFNEPNDLSNTINVRTRLLIYTGGNKELWEFLVLGIVQVIAERRLKIMNGYYRLNIEKKS
jgi:hypothetical protein